MKQIFYAYQNIIRSWGKHIIKIVSLAVGILVSILLFARVAFELNYDKFYPESEKLFLIQCALPGDDGLAGEPTSYVYGKLPGAIFENFPEQIESATVIREDMSFVLFKGDQRFPDIKGIAADHHLFETTGNRVLKGNATALERPNTVFLSESAAKRIFGDVDPVNKTLLQDKEEQVTVVGVFADIPENSELRYDAVYSMATLFADERGGWGYDLSYLGLFRFRNTTSAIDNVTARITEMLKQYLPDEEMLAKVKFGFIPVSAIHSGIPDVRRMILIMSVLAIVLLLVTALNYVLISISAMPRRAKGVGVHKCSGASTGAILRIFLWETFFIIACSLLLAAFLLSQFQPFIEDAIQVSLEGLFAWNTLWIPLTVVLILFVIAGMLPGRLYASVPVTQVFRRYTEHKLSWKRPLLFIQFAGVAFIFGLLIIVLMQYSAVMNEDLGYNGDRIAYGYVRSASEERESIKGVIRDLPMVEDISTSWSPICNGYSGIGVFDLEGRKILNEARLSFCDFHFLPMMQVRLVKGKYVDGADQVVVNEKFLESVGWTNDPLGKKIDLKWGNPKTIVGVIKNYTNRNAYSPKEPIIWGASKEWGGTYNIRLKEPFDSNLEALNKRVGEMFPTKDVAFTSVRKRMDEQYDAVRRFRNLVTLASLAILFITLMGLLGYTNDEVLRRSKEIAIRKVNGAEVSDILRLLSESVFWIALPAVVLGVIAAWYIGGKWLEQFSESVSPGLFVYLGIALLVLVLIIGSVILRAWRVANENPVNSIKSE